MGHSVGEVAAAVISGALSLSDGIKTIYHRSIQQKKCEGQGRMLAINMPKATVDEILKDYPNVAIACHNGPEDFVLAGEQASVERLSAFIEKEFPDTFARVRAS